MNNNLVSINGVLMHADGSKVSHEVWAEWQQARVAARNAREDFEAKLNGKDLRMGGGIQWSRSEREAARKA